MRPKLPEVWSGATSRPITKPGYLIELGFVPVLRFSTRGDLTFNGAQFISGFVAAYDNAARRLTLVNQDNAISSIVLAQGVADRSVKVWQFYGDLAVPEETVLSLDGYIDGAPSIGDRVTLSLYTASAGAMYSPRHRITRHNGYSVLPVPGLRIQWGQALFILKSEWEK
jgi:hypothetical protein